MREASTGGSAGRSQGTSDHWNRRAEQLLGTLLHAASIENATMRTVVKWVGRQTAGPAQSILDQSGSELAANVLGSISMLTANELSGIWSTTANVLAAYNSERALESTMESSGERFDPQEWVKTNGTIYICASSRHQRLVSPLVVGLLTEVTSASYKRSKEIGSGRAVDERGSAPLLLALDEAANIAPIPDMENFLSEGGGQGVVTMLCLQDLSQARARWGPEVDGWFSLFGSKVMLRGIEDIKTLETISALAGEEEVVTRSVSAPVVNQPGRAQSVLEWAAGRRMPPPQQPTVTTSTVRRRRFPVDELSRGLKGKALLIDDHSGMEYIDLTSHHEHELWKSIIKQGQEQEQKLIRKPPEGPDLGLSGP
jgi:type IV secretory pathway TraG/TraD family ATPase VirD4